MARDRSSRPEAKPLRLFVAVDIPEDVKSRLGASLQPFRERVPGARWTSTEGWHVTLKFLGSTWPRLVESVRNAVRSAAAGQSSFESALSEIGAFPSAKRARVLWAGLANPQGRFGTLVATLDDLLREHFVPEKRVFTPHLTVARLNPMANLLDAAPDLFETSVASRPFAVDCLVLYRSHLSPRGARYEAVDRFPLRSS
ncbi:MAG TPA: RNA 2',3'-cyclic phosphodiesterase [Actinomycetota bacterium]|nr:RNA 2',3'-cyclic phosphodiesterase [Actinomycetota bacterium]